MAMELSAASLSEDQFTCSICLDVFNNPVSTSCGHSFCQACISSYWDTKVGAKSYECPLCKEPFRRRPELHINRTLKEITEQFKQIVSSGGQGVDHPNSHPRHRHPSLSLPQRAGELPGTVFAEMMNRFQQLQTPGTPNTHPSSPDDPLPQSPAPFSDEHQDPPPPYSPPRRHTVSVPSDSFQNLPKCPLHLRALELFCRTDNICICSSCVETAEHRGHSVTPAQREWHSRKSQLGVADVELKGLISERERKVEEIHNSLREIQAAVETQTHGTVCVFSKLISSLERCQAEVLEVLERSRRAAEHRAEVLLTELQEEVSELRKRREAVSQLALTEDYVLFLRSFPALSSPPPAKDWSSVSVVSELTSGAVLRTVYQMMERVQEEIQQLPKVFQQSSEHAVPKTNPMTRKVQEYATNVILDANTAHPRLIISADGRQVQCGERHQSLPDYPERFDRVVCVLGRQGLSSGRHYWEVEVGGKTDWDLGVASHSVNRKGKITVSPAHGYWFLSLRDRTDYAFRTEPSTNLTVNPRPTRVGVFVDCDKGVVSFYNMEARLLIFTFTDVFPDTIHAFFSPCTNKSGRNEAPLIICPVAMPE
ncbi:E3 ubiquitin-protein ligase TRIM68-like [Trematomus bernacchii]|uniref:E3 ubiquitin-protein ligase TRIM68-like n=1 Tax=Trematomus bernacchii TaxID=40690 RepID=UPI00146E78FC|nr:E3 ubiquitin-protein ligase TRIM68-like [Trematomus bernacchii]XP_033984395.1 E3 ubiquitin-protein ligase TRIM68-like [Trematomus bernacchii]XP_033984406.1 E3 ubiquitin-protein ligase TRIM68-like [Trematomus bernacchii]